MSFVEQAEKRGYEVKMLDAITCELYLANGKLVARVAIDTMEVGSAESLDAWFSYLPRNRSEVTAQ